MKYFIALFLLSGLLLVSCKKQGCTDSTATNYDSEAGKDDGSCVFPDPEPDPRDPYLGTYTILDSNWLSGSFYEEVTYNLAVTTGGTVSDSIYLGNLWNDGVAYLAVLTDSSFSIPSQQVSGPYYATGSGNFANNILTYETSGDVYVNEGSGPKQ